MIRIILGPALFAKDSPFKVLGDRFNRFFFAHVTLIGVYPVCKVLFIALLILLQYELFHFGADFTLKFEWLKNKPK
ncbi:hypothetical protein PF002_g22301 [Phytophthora fragariae]|uniref:Uncharacterized protein n=1 Tax=Phytophthora fragariae TaxID=53985 RepID=A0A6A3X9Q6_9STRA|nr:hypothetical protein PF009_g22126 [Phytophthora fragariae]KAE9013374.1 hypothetical protein PF011_g8515 [Phytophthora fragariae]KAE9111689.1 hypothetical protein PF006_g20150 [Phytophthora fragariae]KAE9198900.1 hypothetical protein PF002_g22301 [Phytophthora fragariae]KAE9348705.1 hypothetical protein PF008_g7236 [Phytophthora fragariae]